MRRKKKNANKSVNLQVLPIVNPNAAGIDVGAKDHLVAVPCDRDPKPVRTSKPLRQTFMNWRLG
jgi:transposase